MLVARYCHMISRVLFCLFSGQDVAVCVVCVIAIPFLYY